MAIQSFSVGQVLTAAQVNGLQANDYNQTVSNKTASYTLVAADKGTRIAMSSTSATTITVNTGLFSAGDTLFIQNLNTGVSTITAGTATVTTSSSLALAQWEGGTLYFTSASAAIFFKSDGAAAGGGGKVLQVVSANTTTITSIVSATYTDTTITATITPTSATSKILILGSAISYLYKDPSTSIGAGGRLVRDSTTLFTNGNAQIVTVANASYIDFAHMASWSYLDSPATTSATTYKIQANTNGSVEVRYQVGNNTSVITLLEIGA